jgi:excisionase family DNA binding protein
LREAKDGEQADPGEVRSAAGHLNPRVVKQAVWGTSKRSPAMPVCFTLDGLEETVRALVQAELARLEHEAHERWYTASEAAEYLRVSVQRIHDLVSQGRLPRYGGKGCVLRFRRHDLDRYIEERSGRRGAQGGASR